MKTQETKYYTVAKNGTWSKEAATEKQILSMIKVENKSIADARLNGDKTLFIEGQNVAALFVSQNEQKLFMINQGLI